jgi:large subunit ribosomal protein L16
MFLQPKQRKFKKEQKGKINGITFESLNFGTFGIRSLEHSRFNAKQIEMARRIISKRVKSTGKLWVRVFPSKPITSKPNEVRMGKGKGAVSYWVANIRPGKILYEIDGISDSLAFKIFRTLTLKLPFKINLIQYSQFL